jgi:hypothetical protein
VLSLAFVSDAKRRTTASRYCMGSM